MEIVTKAYTIEAQQAELIHSLAVEMKPLHYVEANDSAALRRIISDWAQMREAGVNLLHMQPTE